MARSITPDILLTILQKWPMFLTLIGAVIFFATALGFALARWKVLPGTTAVWGSSPGAATAMVLMADAFGGDMRLVAVMQYLRVACVGLVASIVARAWSASGAAAPVAIDWFPHLAAGPFLGTLALAIGGAVIGVKSRIPAGALLLPLFVGAPLSASHLLTITLPPWLLADMLRPRRLVHRSQVHAGNRALRGETIAEDPGLDLHPDRHVRGSGVCVA